MKSRVKLNSKLETMPTKEVYSNENSYKCNCKSKEYSQALPKRNRRILCTFVAKDETQGITILTECKVVRTTDEAFYEYMQFERFMREEVWPLVKHNFNGYTCKLTAHWVRR